VDRKNDFENILSEGAYQYWKKVILGSRQTEEFERENIHYKSEISRWMIIAFSISCIFDLLTLPIFSVNLCLSIVLIWLAFTLESEGRLHSPALSRTSKGYILPVDVVIGKIVIVSACSLLISFETIITGRVLAISEPIVGLRFAH
jgi:hypothetical protein